MIDRHIEEPLNLRGVQIHRQDAICPGVNDQVGGQFRRDGHAARVLPVLSRIAEIGDDGRDASRTGALAGVDHDQQFHQILIHRRARRLNEEHIAAADVLIDLHPGFAVREIPDLDRPQR